MINEGSGWNWVQSPPAPSQINPQVATGRLFEWYCSLVLQTFDKLTKFLMFQFLTKL